MKSIRRLLRKKLLSKRSSFKKAILWGLTAAVIVYIVILVLQTAVGLWEPLVRIIGIHNSTLRWLLSLGLTIVAVTLVGYAIVIAHPFKGIMNKILGVKAREAKSVVLVEWGGNWFYGWFTGIIEVNEQTLYRVTVPSAPVPITGQLMLVPRDIPRDVPLDVPRDRIIFTDITMTEHLTQLASMGFNGMRTKIGTRDEP